MGANWQSLTTPSRLEETCRRSEFIHKSATPCFAAFFAIPMKLLHQRPRSFERRPGQRAILLESGFAFLKFKEAPV
jgi:hypothetical protein